VCLCALPRYLRELAVSHWPQRHIVLGLDLQGGLHLLLEVDTNAVFRLESAEIIASVSNLIPPTATCHERELTKRHAAQRIFY
jgi:preprotein translocase subunit SecD